MKLSEHEPFTEACKKALKIYEEWNDVDEEIGRAILGGGDNNGNCIVMFKGTNKDVLAIERFLEHLDERNGK